MPQPYSESLLVEQPALELFRWMGWETVSATTRPLVQPPQLGARPKAKSSSRRICVM